MAIWQYTFHVLSKESVLTLNPNMFFKVGDDGLFDDDLYWKYCSLKKQYFSEIGCFLRKTSSWSQQIDLYGSTESNCVEVYFDQETEFVESVSFRIDFTTSYEVLLQNMIEFCIFKNLILLNEELVAVPLNFESLSKIIEIAHSKYIGLVNSITSS